MTAQPLLREGVCDRVADAEPDDPNPEQTESVLLLGGDQVPITVEPHGAKGPRTQNSRDSSSPRVVGPALRFRDHVGVG